ncbi:hypothetical protein [Parvibaculum sp.]|uniref:hypothetical protein n=1 Tax=Parvibaculum sp. TaxID=2024848 RepID=UPI000C8F710F|nr:hypothetical protein [Parvibaculum sp.]MAB13892.1 hypothetical protein [Parvibaculum sp.]
MRSIQAPTVFVHTGTVKTGSTYIQKAFYDNRTVFERFGVSYPTVSPLTIDRYANADFTLDRSWDEEAREAITGAATPQVLISEEGIFGMMSRLWHPAFEGLPVNRNRYPAVYRTEREPYRPVDMQEVEMLMNGILSRKG